MSITTYCEMCREYNAAAVYYRNQAANAQAENKALRAECGAGGGGMSEKVPAILSWHLFTDCPKCGDQIDLSSPENDSDGYVPTCIFSNAWNKLNGHKVECECGHEFEIEVEY